VTEYESRRRKRFNPSRAAVRLGEILEEFSPLRALPAFEDAERRIVRTLDGYFPTLVQEE